VKSNSTAGSLAATVPKQNNPNRNPEIILPINLSSFATVITNRIGYQDIHFHILSVLSLPTGPAPVGARFGN
jgi:hypothetical protein